MSDILDFSGENHWLSNFFPCKIMLDGEEYASIEHAYQAAKTLDDEEREIFRDKETTAAMAKYLGKHVQTRHDWDDIKLAVMENCLKQKFQPGNIFGQKLISTGSARIMEGNHWGDTFWGICKGRGHNHLGRLIMEIRDNISKESA